MNCRMSPFVITVAAPSSASATPAARFAVSHSPINGANSANGPPAWPDRIVSMAWACASEALSSTTTPIFQFPSVMAPGKWFINPKAMPDPQTHAGVSDLHAIQMYQGSAQYYCSPSLYYSWYYYYSYYGTYLKLPFDGPVDSVTFDTTNGYAALIPSCGQ